MSSNIFLLKTLFLKFQKPYMKIKSKMGACAPSSLPLSFINYLTYDFSHSIRSACRRSIMRLQRLKMKAATAKPTIYDRMSHQSKPPTSSGVSSLITHITPVPTSYKTLRARAIRSALLWRCNAISVCSIQCSLKTSSLPRIKFFQEC